MLFMGIYPEEKTGNKPDFLVKKVSIIVASNRSKYIAISIVACVQIFSSCSSLLFTETLSPDYLAIVYSEFVMRNLTGHDVVLSDLVEAAISPLLLYQTSKL